MNLSRKLVATFSVAMTLILTICLTFIYFTTTNIMLEQEKSKSLSILHTFESSMYENESIENIQKSLNNLKSNEGDIINFNIYSLGDNSTGIAAINSENLGKKADPEDLQAAKDDKVITIIDKSIIDVTAPLHTNGKVTYAAGIEVSIQDELSTIHSMLLKVIFSGLLSIVIAILFILLISKNLFHSHLKN